MSSNECAICLGEYEDDVGEEGELLLSWVECTNPECKKWMHEQCYKRHMFVMFATEFFLLVWRAHPMYCLYITVHDSGIIPSICTNLFTECVPTMFLTLIHFAILASPSLVVLSLKSSSGQRWVYVN